MPTSILLQPTSLKPFTLIPKALKPQGWLRILSMYNMLLRRVHAAHSKNSLLGKVCKSTKQNWIMRCCLQQARFATQENSKAQKQNRMAQLSCTYGPVSGLWPDFPQKNLQSRQLDGPAGLFVGFRRVLATYIELLSLNNLFAPSKSAAGSYVLYHNHLPHNSGFASSHDYFGNPDNFRFSLQESPKSCKNRTNKTEIRI